MTENYLPTEEDMLQIIPSDPEGAERVAIQEALGIKHESHPVLDDLARRLRISAGGTIAGFNILGDDLKQFFPGMSHAQFDVLPDEARAMEKNEGYCVFIAAKRKRPLVIPDVYDYPPFAGNPVVDKNGVRAYAGMPLLEQRGRLFGTVWVVDDKPRHDWAKQARNEEMAVIKIIEPVRKLGVEHFTTAA